MSKDITLVLTKGENDALWRLLHYQMPKPADDENEYMLLREVKRKVGSIYR